MQASVIRLVPDTVSEETIRALEFLLKEAKAGRVIGLALIAMHRIDDYSVDATGACKSLPHIARGMIATLDDELSQLEPAQA